MSVFNLPLDEYVFSRRGFYKIMKKCLFCPDEKVPEYSRFLTGILDPHHIQKRRNSDYTIPCCRYHHTLIELNKIPRQLIVDKANEHYGKDLFYLPYPESKKIKVRSEDGVN